MTPDAAAREITTKVTGARPLLLPAIPATWLAELTTTPSSFHVVYRNSTGTQTVDFAIVVPNPPPATSNGRQAHPAFHGDRLSLYQVDDDTQPTSHRWLMWNEPGTWSQPNGLPGVPYFLATTGFSETDFWSMANSVHG